jgi:hypothetical protein
MRTQVPKGLKRSLLRRARIQVPKGRKRTAKAGYHRRRRGGANDDDGVENPWMELFLARPKRLWSHLSIPFSHTQALLGFLSR